MDSRHVIARLDGPAVVARMSRVMAPTIIVVALAAAAIELAVLATRPGLDFGHDFHLYRDAAERWLTTGAFYLPYQLAGPYRVVTEEVMYPPTILPLLVPFTVLPAILWWAMPLGYLGWRVVAWRPAAWGWAAIAVLLAFPLQRDGFSLVIEQVVNGNPGMWIAAFVAGGLAHGWPAVLVLLKPTMLPFALVGLRHRSWWVAVAVMAAVSLVALPLWLDYVTAIRNAWGGVDIWYTVNNVPLLLVPVVAWTARTVTHASVGRSLATARTRSRGASGHGRSAQAR